MRGCLAHHQGEYQQAAKHFSEASRLLPKRPLVENRLGVAHYRLNDLDKAAAAFERALQAASGEMPTLSLTLRQNLHFVLRKLGRDKDAQKHWLVLNRVPSRPHKLTSASIDLSQHYNAALDRDWFDPRYTNSLVELQPGVHRFDGVEFDVRGLIQLASTVVDKNRFPTSADIIVDQKCTAIHFLYGAIHATDPDNTTIGSCRVIFKDGSSRELPLEMGKNIRDWWAPLGAKESLNLPEATCVWVGTNPTIEPRKLQLCILKTTWNNESQQTVDRLEVSTSMRKGAPFLVAVSLEKSSRTD